MIIPMSLGRGCVLPWQRFYIKSGSPAVQSGLWLESSFEPAGGTCRSCPTHGWQAAPVPALLALRLTH